MKHGLAIALVASYRKRDLTSLSCQRSYPGALRSLTGPEVGDGQTFFRVSRCLGELFFFLAEMLGRVVLVTSPEDANSF